MSIGECETLSIHRPMKDHLALATLLVVVLTTPATAQISCGDTLGPGGKFVAAGPIGPCPQNPALTILGPVKVDFAGHEVSCDATSSNGINIEGKSATVENGAVARCNVGFHVQGEGKHKLTRLVARNNAGDGFVLEGGGGNKLKECASVFNEACGFVIESSDKNALTGCRSVRNLDTGFFFDAANGNKVKDCTSAEDFEEGFRILGQGNKLTNVDATQSGSHGFEVNGNGNTLKDVTATGSMSTGFVISEGAGIKLSKCASVANGQRGILVGSLADGTKVSKCRTIKNGAEGITVDSGAGDVSIDKNVAFHNVLDDLEDANAGCGTNTWKKNTFGTSNPAAPGCIE